jgi:hypothetical protein
VTPAIPAACPTDVERRRAQACSDASRDYPLTDGEVAERLMAALLKSAESKDFVGSNPTLSAITTDSARVR